MSKTRDLAATIIFEAFKILKDAGGELRGKEVMEKIEKTIPLDDWAKETYEKTGNIRWQSILHFYTIDCIKSGFLEKEKGIWILTKEGEEAIKLGSVELLNKATKLYREWDANRKDKEGIDQEDLELDAEPDQLQKANLEQLEEKSIDGLRKYLISKNPYEFQDIVAALLRAMGYYTPFVSPKGRDGGIDVIAYQDPLGTKTPRIKVQVKHRPDAAIAVDEIRQLVGLLNDNGDVGLFITSGRFTSEAENFSRTSHKHIELIDFEKFITLWQEFYDKLTDEDKNRLPLYKIYFLGSNE
ncbi:MAG: restriction endonuclease [Candidatus Pacebacteria bacterium]|nr:restriction endonuclease [Candidatus Paceibacterota bacterium]